MIQIKLKRLTETAVIPKYQSNGAAAIDLHADMQGYKRITFCGLEYAIIISTGIAVQIPHGYVGIIVPRSGLGHREGLILGHSTGVIDSDYRGEIVVSMCNRHNNKTYTIHPGDRFAQMLFMPVEQATFIEVDELDGTERGDGGLGSTGV